MTYLQLPDASAGATVAAIGWLYLFTNVARVFSFVPQIVAVWRCVDGARSISLLTWGLWTVSHVTAVIYGVMVVHDAFFVFISAVNLVGCGVVTLITSRRRLAARRAARIDRDIGWTRA